MASGEHKTAVSNSAPANFFRGARHSAHQQRRHAAVLGMLQGLHGSVLDVGCGYGDLTWAMSRVLGPVQGVDVDPDRVAFAGEQYAPIQFSVCRANGLDFADASFDNVVSIVVTPFVPDVDEHMSELHRVLKPGGHLVLATRSTSWLRRVYRRWAGGSRPPSRLHHHTAFEGRRLLQMHGFELVRGGAFFDPPLGGHRNIGDWANAVVDLAGEWVGAVEMAPYPVFLARRADE